MRQTEPIPAWFRMEPPPTRVERRARKRRRNRRALGCLGIGVILSLSFMALLVGAFLIVGYALR